MSDDFARTVAIPEGTPLCGASHPVYVQWYGAPMTCPLPLGHSGKHQSTYYPPPSSSNIISMVEWP